jgi:hypothetical protein
MEKANRNRPSTPTTYSIKQKEPRGFNAKKPEVNQSQFSTFGCRKTRTKPASTVNVDFSAKALGRLNLEKQDPYALFFSHTKTLKAAKTFIEWLKNRGSYATRGQLSNFTRQLEAGKILKGFRYRRSSFYRTVLKRLVNLGFIALQQRYDISGHGVVYAYAPVYQIIPRKPPLGSESFWWHAWHIAKVWNEQFSFSQSQP